MEPETERAVETAAAAEAVMPAAIAEAVMMGAISEGKMPVLKIVM